MTYPSRVRGPDEIETVHEARARTQAICLRHGIPVQVDERIRSVIRRNDVPHFARARRRRARTRQAGSASPKADCENRTREIALPAAGENSHYRRIARGKRCGHSRLGSAAGAQTIWIVNWLDFLISRVRFSTGTFVLSQDLASHSGARAFVNCGCSGVQSSAGKKFVWS